MRNDSQQRMMRARDENIQRNFCCLLLLACCCCIPSLAGEILFRQILYRK